MGKMIQILTAVNGRGRHVLVDPRLETNVVILQHTAGQPHLLIKLAQRGALIPGDVGTDSQPGLLVAPVLVDGNAHHRLDSVEGYLPFELGILVV